MIYNIPINTNNTDWLEKIITALRDIRCPRNRMWIRARLALGDEVSDWTPWTKTLDGTEIWAPASPLYSARFPLDQSHLQLQLGGMGIDPIDRPTAILSTYGRSWLDIAAQLNSDPTFPYIPMVNCPSAPGDIQ